MARDYSVTENAGQRQEQRHRAFMLSVITVLGTLGLAASPLLTGVEPGTLFALGLIPAAALGWSALQLTRDSAIERERLQESTARSGRPVLGLPPERDCFQQACAEAQTRGKNMLDKYLVGFELESGKPLWIADEELCGHGCVFARTGAGKTLWLESLMFQQMARGRASGCTFIDAKRDSATLAHVILMAMVTGRLEDLIVIDSLDSVHSYNFVMTNQGADVKARKVLRAGLPPTSEQSTTGQSDRLAADSIYRLVRAMESFGLSWSIKDIAVSLSAFNLAYPHLRSMLREIGATEAMVELEHLAASYRSAKGMLDTAPITDSLRGIAAELHSIAGSEMGRVFCTKYTDLVLTDAIHRGKIIYFMLPRLEDAESAARMVKVFREDLEVSIAEIASSEQDKLEDPHLVIVDEGSSTFGPTWANLFEQARKGRFALLFGAQSTCAPGDQSPGLSEAFYERVMANVNLKVMMGVGENSTAMEMAEWIGGIVASKHEAVVGETSDESQRKSVSENEADPDSTGEPRHEMSSEKGLAWFDLGNGRVVHGRSFWFNAELPEKWEGREYLPRFEKLENDEIGLADWVDKHILSQEQKETTGLLASRTSPLPDTLRSGNGGAKKDTEVTKAGPFKINLTGKVPRPRTKMSIVRKGPGSSEEAAANGSSEEKPPKK